MPETEVVFYLDEHRRAPVRVWLQHLQRQDRRAFARCVARIRRLAERGHELRRPEADYVTDGLYELRARTGRVHRRILYFFHGRCRAVLVHAFTKEGRVPTAELERAKRRRKAYLVDPDGCTFREDP